VLSLISSVLFAPVGPFNMQDTLAHSTISFVPFLIMIAAMVVGEIQTQREKFTSLKLICIAVTFWNLFGMAALVRVKETSIRFSLLGISSTSSSSGPPLSSASSTTTSDSSRSSSAST
jgi:hypothetical membrane protein